MRLIDLPRTTSFRLALLFVVLFGLSSLTLFGFLYWRMEGFLVSRVDDWLIRERIDFLREEPARLPLRLDNRARNAASDERIIALFDAGGQRIAGNSVAFPQQIPVFDKPFEFVLPKEDGKDRFRGLVHRLPSGSQILIAQNLEEIQEFDQVLVNALIWGGAITVVLGLAGAAGVGAGAIRRIDAVTLAIERIVQGDLSSRLPTRGTSDDVDRLVRVVNGMLDEIERLMQEVKGTCDNIAHDLRTPLTRLLGGLERARRRAATVDEYAAAVDEGIEETRGLLKTFTALLRISEVEDSVRRAGFVPVNLVEIAKDVVEFYEPYADEQNVTLTFRADIDAAQPISGDPSLLFEAIGNLVDNAIKFTPGGGRVTVRVFHHDRTLGVAIEDTGPGIADAERDAVLRRFYRAEKSRSAPGHGLGLSLVAAVARLHRMELIIEDGRPGTTFKLQSDTQSG
jgi:signal transduction histidine kinase